MNPVTCSWCGATAPALPLDWVLSSSGEREDFYCATCARANLRAIEGRLDQEWW